MPVKALTNDNFSRDISTKVRSSQSIKREKGDYLENGNYIETIMHLSGVLKEVLLQDRKICLKQS